MSRPLPSLDRIIAVLAAADGKTPDAVTVGYREIEAGIPGVLGPVVEPVCIAYKDDPKVIEQAKLIQTVAFTLAELEKDPMKNAITDHERNVITVHHVHRHMCEWVSGDDPHAATRNSTMAVEVRIEGKSGGERVNLMLPGVRQFCARLLEVAEHAFPELIPPERVEPLNDPEPHLRRYQLQWNTFTGWEPVMTVPPAEPVEVTAPEHMLQYLNTMCGKGYRWVQVEEH